MREAPVVKICGITNAEDAVLAVGFGADALGFNFYEKSPRYIDAGKASRIIQTVPSGVRSVGVFVNEPLGSICFTASCASLDVLQFHGNETPEYILDAKRRTGLEIIKAFRVGPEFNAEEVLSSGAESILLDSFSSSVYGGTGESFDWETAKLINGLVPRMYLAGGLNPSNIAEAIESVQPYGVDACSGLESSKGKKDKAKLEAFLKIAKHS